MGTQSGSLVLVLKKTQAQVPHLFIWPVMDSGGDDSYLALTPHKTAWPLSDSNAEVQAGRGAGGHRKNLHQKEPVAFFSCCHHYLGTFAD